MRIRTVLNTLKGDQQDSADICRHEQHPKRPNEWISSEDSLKLTFQCPRLDSTNTGHQLKQRWRTIWIHFNIGKCILGHWQHFPSDKIAHITPLLSEVEERGCPAASTCRQQNDSPESKPHIDGICCRLIASGWPTRELGPVARRVPVLTAEWEEGLPIVMESDRMRHYNKMKKSSNSVRGKDEGISRETLPSPHVPGPLVKGRQRLASRSGRDFLRQCR